MVMHIPIFTLVIIVALLAAFMMLLSSGKTRLIGIILLGSFLTLFLLGIVWWSVSELPHSSQVAQIDLPPGYRQNPRINVGNNSENISVPIAQLNSEDIKEFDNTAAKSAGDWPDNSLVAPPASQNPSTIRYDGGGFQMSELSGGPSIVGIIVFLAIGLLLIGGLVLAIAMLFNRKTRPAGVTMLVAGPIVLILIAAGLVLFARLNARSNINYAMPAHIATATEVVPANSNKSQQVSAVPVPPAYNANPSSPVPAAPAPNSKQLFEAYEAAINYYCKAIAQPLKMDKIENASEKVSTLRVSFRDIGEVTVSGSSIMINSIGQALAKAMNEKMKENNTPVEIAPANESKTSTSASAPANSAAAQPVAANAPLKKEIWAEKMPGKTNTVKNTKAPKTKKTEPAVLAKAEADEIAKQPSDAKRPDWVGKPPFLRRAENQLPDYYRVGVLNSNPNGELYVKVVSTDPYTTRLECEAKIPELLQEAVDQYVETYLGHKWAGYVRLPPEQLRQLVVAEYEELWQSQALEGPMPRMHLLLNFDQKAKEFISDATNARLFTDRASVTGSGLIGVWLLLAVVWGYLKIDISTKGVYRTRLRAAAGFAIISIVVIGLAVLRSLA
jgi:hypothetical protein